jgi:hypothetical protein
MASGSPTSRGSIKAETLRFAHCLDDQILRGVGDSHLEWRRRPWRGR